MTGGDGGDGGDSSRKNPSYNLVGVLASHDLSRPGGTCTVHGVCMRNTRDLPYGIHSRNGHRWPGLDWSFHSWSSVEIQAHAPDILPVR